MTRHAVHLRALTAEGWHALLRTRSVWVLAAGALVMSATALWAKIPLKEQGIFNLSAMAMIDQLLVLMLVGAQITAIKPAAPRAAWPCSPEVAIPCRSVGMIAFCAVLLAGVVAVQYAGVAYHGDLEARVLMQEAGERLDGRYALLWCGLVAYAGVLLAWGQTLRLVFGPGVALLTLMVLVFSGFVLPRLGQDHPGLGVIVALFPDLGSLAPVRLAENRDWNPRIFLYAGVHVAAVWMVGAVLLRILRDRGAHVDSTGGAA